jgi:6-phosphogluconolactonase (cycloisomerase 2 family)
VDPSGRFAYVANAGGTVSTYAIDTRDAGISGAFPGALTTPGSVAAGTNPVSVTVHPSGQFAYVVNNSGVQRFTINATSGALTAVGSAVAAGTTPVSISVDASGKFAYVANAGGGVTRFTIDAGTGALTGPVTTAAGTGPSSVTTTGTSQ